jgi:hypothetical protein
MRTERPKAELVVSAEEYITPEGCILEKVKRRTRRAP